MDKYALYRIIDIESPEEFKYFDNLSALFESDEYIEADAVAELISDVDLDTLEELTETFFEEYLKHIPDEETDLYILVDQIKRVITGKIKNMDSLEAADDLADEIIRFRKWYVIDSHAFDLINGYEVSMMDARYNIAAAKFTGEEFRYDYRTALDYNLDGYDIAVSDMLMQEEDYEA